jgi:hypothetical protein
MGEQNIEDFKEALTEMSNEQLTFYARALEHSMRHAYEMVLEEIRDRENKDSGQEERSYYDR